MVPYLHSPSATRMVRTPVMVIPPPRTEFNIGEIGGATPILRFVTPSTVKVSRVIAARILLSTTPGSTVRVSRVKCRPTITSVGGKLPHIVLHPRLVLRPCRMGRHLRPASHILPIRHIVRSNTNWTHTRPAIFIPNRIHINNRINTTT